MQLKYLNNFINTNSIEKYILRVTILNYQIIKLYIYSVKIYYIVSSHYKHYQVTNKLIFIVRSQFLIISFLKIWLPLYITFPNLNIYKGVVIITIDFIYKCYIILDILLGGGIYLFIENAYIGLFIQKTTDYGKWHRV